MGAAFRDYYEVLGVPRTASQKDIKAAFRRLARAHHPDVNPGDGAASRRFIEINEAHEVLGDPEKRRRYDELGPRWREYEAWEQAGRPGPNPFEQAQGPEVEYRTVSPEDLEDLFGAGDPFSDFFHGVFGRGAAASAGTASAGARRRRGQDVEGDVDVSLEEAFSGTTRTVELERAGTTRRVQVRIPAGIADGARVRAAGQGGAGGDGGDAGDLYIRVHVRPHSVFRREGDAIHLRVPVPLDVALLGGQVSVPTLRGRSVQLTVPAGTQNGARLRLRGLGMPHLRGGGAGDLIAEVDVRLPLPVGDELRTAAEQLRRVREADHAG